MIETNVCIIGAGPGGTATALKLDQLGIPSILIDKATFPRDKICGDALSGKVITILNRIDPDMVNRFIDQQKAIDVWGIKFVAPNQKEMNLSFWSENSDRKQEVPGYVAKRIDFDYFLINEVKNRKSIQLYEGVKMDHFEKVDGGYLVSDTSKNLVIKTKLLIDCSGAHSSFARKIGGIEKEPRHYAGSVRAYYENVTGFTNGNLIELHFVKDFLPGYFWIFPLPNGMANVGVGMLTSEISKRKVNLKEQMLSIIEDHPKFKERFKNAKIAGGLKGFGLPLGSKKRVLSGDHYMLVGDAASLIDPMTGEGIGNAIYSGAIAAEQAQKCLEENDFTKKRLTAYDQRVYRVMGKELEISSFFQKTLFYPSLFNFIASRTSRNKHLQEILSCAFMDIDLRARLTNPFFWMKLIFNLK